MVTDKQFKELLDRFDELEAKYKKMSQDIASISMMMDANKRRKKEQTQVQRKDVTRYVFMGKQLNKRQLVLECVKQYIDDNKITSFTSLLEVFPDHIQGPLGVIRKAESAEQYKDATDRYYFEDENVIHLDEGIYVVSKEWTVNNINGFIDVMETLGYKIDFINR